MHGTEPEAYEANMTNCYEQCEQFFKTHHSVHLKVLLTYWLLAGYFGLLDSEDSFAKAYGKAQDALVHLRREKILQLAKSAYRSGALPLIMGSFGRTLTMDWMVKFVIPTATYPKHVDCKHQGPCTKDNFSFDEFLSNADIDSIINMRINMQELEGAVDVNNLSRQVIIRPEKSTRLMDPELHNTPKAYYEVNMTNCYEQLEQFFKTHQSVHCKVLLTYWVLAGYFGRLISDDAVLEAYERGKRIIDDLISEVGILKVDIDEMVEFVTPTDSKHVDCKHQGLCTKAPISFDDFLSKVDIHNILLLDTETMTKQKLEGLVNGEYLWMQVFSPANEIRLRGCSSARAYPMHPGNEVNMTNCYEQCEQFFKRHQSVHYRVLVAYWMMAGYVGPVGADSLEEAYNKGHDILIGLVHEEGILKLSDDDEGEMVEFVTPTNSKRVGCKHQGICTKQPFGFDELLSLDEIDNFLLIDGMLKKQKLKGSINGNHLSRQVSRSHEALNYLAHLNPTLKSLRHLLRKVKKFSVLLLRDCGSLPLINVFHERFKTLTALEISGLNVVDNYQLQGISSMNQLQYLNLSDLDMVRLPDGFFEELLELRRIILRGCSSLRSLPKGPHLKKLQVIDLSHCTNLHQAFFFDNLYYEELQMVDVSYTALGPKLNESSVIRDSHCLTHLYLGELRTFYWLEFQINENLRVLDLSGCRGINNLGITKHLDRKISVLILRGCTSLYRLPKMKELPNLEFLDVSGCRSLRCLPKDLGTYLIKLKELNLSGCSSLWELRSGVFDRMSCLEKLDLSATPVNILPSFSNLTSLSKLSLRGLELDSLQTIASLSNLVELDLSSVKISSSQEFKLDFLECLGYLQILNLSRTIVAKLPDISKLVSLRELLLADCQHLNALPDLKTLTNLEILDLSLQDDSIISKAEVEEDAQRGLSLSAPTSLRKLLLTNRSSVQTLFALTSLGKSEFLDLRGTDVALTDEGVLSRMRNPQVGHLQQTITKPAQIHIVSVSNKPSHQPSGFHDNKDGVSKIDTFISSIQEASNHASNSNNYVNDNDATNIDRLGMLQSDWKYVLTNIDRLKSSLHSEDLFEELIDVATRLSAADFPVDSTNFKQLFRIIIKLKVLMVPPKQVDKVEATGTRKKKSWFTRSNAKEGDGADRVEELSTQQRPDLVSSYHSLDNIQKKCLLCFSVFPCDDGNTGALKIKKRVLIYWWVGEGFIDPHHEDNISQADASRQLSKPMTIEEIGNEILKVLTEKEFIEPVMKKGRETGTCHMHRSVHSFVSAQAKEEGFFDFNPENSTTCTLHPTPFHRACLLKPQGNIASSSKLWANCISSNRNLECFQNVKTLLNVNEPMIDIKQEWFSKMKNLCVLHLGSWRSENAEHIEVVNYKFLEDLKRMNQLKLLSLQGSPTVTRLPDSICKLANLIILDLRECSYLEELPATIGSLKNLTHLDITDCRLLYKLPKGIRLLSKLEVLKGFVITYVGGILQENEVCCLRDLLKLGSLRALSLVVNVARFPDGNDLQVFKELRNLRKLKISWEKNCSSKGTEDASTQGESTQSKWQKLKRWGHQSNQDETPRPKHLDNIEKLELWCFPHGTAPDWLIPSELKNLKKLYIVGGKLSILHGAGGTGEIEWNVTTLHLKYLRYLDIRWLELKRVFPNMKYLEKHHCRKLTLFFPCDEEGVWVDESEKKDTDEHNFEKLNLLPYVEEGMWKDESECSSSDIDDEKSQYRSDCHSWFHYRYKRRYKRMGESE